MRMSSKPARLRDAAMLQSTDLGDASVIMGVQHIPLLGCKERRKAHNSLIGGCLGFIPGSFIRPFKML